MVSPEGSRAGRVLRGLISGIWALAVFLLVIAALYVGVGRFLVTQVGAFETDLENLLSERLGRTVSIGSLSGRWVAFDPVIVVDGLTVGNPEQPDAALQRLRIRLATLTTLVRGRVVFSEFSASHADLTLTQDTQGVLGLSGLWQPAVEEVTGLELLEAAAQDFDANFSDWIEELGTILADPVVRVSDMRLTVQTPGQSDQYYQIPTIDLSFRGGVFSAAGRLKRVDNADTVAWFTLKGRHFFSGSFEGTLYLDLRSERLFDALLQRYEWFNVGVEGLDLRTATWLTFENGGVSRVLAKIVTPYLQLRSPSATLSPIEDLNVLLTARRLERSCQGDDSSCVNRDPGWEFQAKDLEYRWLDRTVGPTSLRWVNAPERWSLAVDSLDIEGIAELIVGLEILPEEVRSALRAYRPRGELSQLLMDFSGAENFRMSARLRQAGVDAHDGAPVIQGLDGWIEQGPDAGRLLFDSNDVIFGFPELFTGAWQLDRMAGEVAWAQVGDGWSVLGHNVRFQYSAETRLGGDFELLLDVDDDTTLGVRVGLVNGTHRHLAQFVPVGAVGPSLYEWLTEAVTNGEIPWGWYYGYGSLSTNEDEGANAETAGLGVGPFTSAMVYDFRALELVYSEEWPRLEGAQGQFRYQDELGWVDIDQSQLGGLELRPSRVRIDTRSGPTRVDLTTGSAVTGINLRHWLDTTALGELASGSTDDVEIEGAADLTLGLTLFPGAGTEAAAEALVDASLALQGVSLTHAGLGYQWHDLAGVVGYDSAKGFSSRDVRGRFLSHDVHFELGGGVAGRPAEIHQWGHATVAEVSERFPQPLPFVEGEFDYDLRLSAGPKPVLGFQVHLAGVAVDLPPPLAKSPADPGLVQGNLVPEDDGSIRLQGTWVDRLAYQMVWREGGLARASVELGEETAPLRDSDFFLSGSVAQLNLDAWADALEPLVATPEEGRDASPAASALPEWPLQADLQVEQLTVGDIDFGAVGLSLAPVGPDWQVGLQGPNLAGSVSWQAEGPHKLAFDRLILPAGEGTESESAETELSGDSRVRYPEADVQIETLGVGDANYGRWQFELRSSADALQVNRILAQTGSLRFSGDLVWQYDRGGKDLTRLTGELEGGNIQDLNAWLDAGVPLNSKTTKARLDLSWPGAPQSFSMRELAGEMALGLKDGTILDQNNVAQVFRVFGILNADTLMRRLRLDFSDLYKAGVSFEALSGSAVVKDGVLTLDPELQLTGPSGAFRLTGSTHLINETLDMRLVVVLPLTQNLPVAALLFGAAAPVGGALFILDKLLGDPLSKLTSATYDVTGVWAQPAVKLRNFFDTGSDIRNYERPELEGTTAREGAENNEPAIAPVPEAGLQ